MTKPPIKGASIAHSRDGNQLFAPSAARNADAIAELLSAITGDTGSALELASGTGQHIIHFAKQMPHITWHPTEVDPTRLASIASYRYNANLPNVRPPQSIDATTAGWSGQVTPKDLIFLANLLHLIAMPSAETLITEAAKALSPHGQFLIYGPFMRDGKLASPGDARFHASLVEQDPTIGYKDVQTIIETTQSVGLSHVQTYEMPANNLALHFRKAP